MIGWVSISQDSAGCISANPQTNHSNVRKIPGQYWWPFSLILENHLQPNQTIHVVIASRYSLMFFSWSHIYGLEARNSKNTSPTDKSFHFVDVDPRCYYEPEMNGSRNVFAEAAFRRVSFARANRTPRCPNPSNSDHALKGFVFMVKLLMKLDLTQSYNKTWILDHLTDQQYIAIWGAIRFYVEPYENTNFGHFNANNNNNNNGGGWRREGWLPISESTKHVHENLQKKVLVSINRLTQFHHSKLSSSYQEDTCPTLSLSLSLSSLNWPNLSTPSKQKAIHNTRRFLLGEQGRARQPRAGGGGRWRAGAGGGGEHEDTSG